MATNKFLLQRIHTIDACLNNKMKRWTKEKLMNRINEVLEEKGRFDKRQIQVVSATVIKLGFKITNKNL